MTTATAARVRRVEPVMGTVFSFDLRVDDVAAESRAERLLDTVVADLRWVDATFSTYRADSEISRLERGALRLADCSPEVRVVLDRCAALTRSTGGYFSATAAGRLDPSALVKGWSIGRVAAALRAGGVDRFAVNGGGDVVLGGPPAPGEVWRIGIADPTRSGALAAVVGGVDLAVATSGTAERGAHVVDPLTGHPADALASLTVIGPDIADADAYATAAFAMGAAGLRWVEDLPGYEAYAVDAAGERSATSGLTRYLAG